jgi:hypothetical protein
MNVDRVLEAYIDCALWSSADTLPDGTVVESLEAYDVAHETVLEMRDEVQDFVDLIEDKCLTDDLSEVQVGHDFWLTRNHHGAGFWDRGLGEQGERLTKWAQVAGSRDLYIGDDGLVHQT